MNEVVQIWNKLMDEVVQAITISIFKARVDSYWHYDYTLSPLPLLSSPTFLQLVGIEAYVVILGWYQY